MALERFGRKQVIGVLGVFAAISGLLLVPIMAQRIYGLSPIKAAFVVIIFYYVLNQYMKLR